MRVARLREDLKQLVVREEVEAREGRALELEVVVEALLDLVELLVGVEESVEQPGRRHLHDDVRVLVALDHAVLEELVDLVELGRLRGELLLDVLGAEDVLEVHP